MSMISVLIEIRDRSRTSHATRIGSARGACDVRLEHIPTGWSHPVDKKSLLIQKLEHIPLKSNGFERKML
jgi:hypothetical protein